MDSNGEKIGCECGGGDCSSSPTLGRRQFLHMAGVGLVSTRSSNRLMQVMAGPFAAGDAASGHLIPADKKLSDAWVKALYERGKKEVFTGKSLDNIGMPCGGIGSGQLYLCGDGTLGCWQIFNDAYSNWVEGTFSTYKHRGVNKPIDQGFVISIDTGAGAPLVKTLDKEGFGGVEFQGEYPIGLVHYRDKHCPIQIDLEAFSPFIPLNAKDSALPATVLNFTAKNISTKPMAVSIAGWLENGVCATFGRQFEATRKTEFIDKDGYTLCQHSAEAAPAAEFAPASKREPIVFEMFEGETYAPWTAGGDAFTKKSNAAQGVKGPAGFEGKGFANSKAGGDGMQGTLTSPVFTIDRRYINFLVGGGNWVDRTCINLVVGGNDVRTAVGEFNDKLAWHSWLVDEWQGKEAQFVIVDKVSEGFGNGVAHILVDQIEFSDIPRVDPRGVIADAPDFGTLALACMQSAKRNAVSAPTPANRPKGQFVTGQASYKANQTRRGLVAASPMKLEPGASHTFTFVVAWYFPNQYIADRYVVSPWTFPKRKVGHAYEDHFQNAAQVIDYVIKNEKKLTTETRLWRTCLYDSTLPYWLLDRIHSTISYLSTGTCQWWKSGRFWAYEGVACCHGTCSHVWNYAHAHARLFPELARNIREMQDFTPTENGGGFDSKTGRVGFRSDDEYAADGQCGTILKAYREHLMSADTAFLKRNWPAIKKALEYSMSRDVNADGIIEDSQPNTYDIEYFGANTFVGSLYLAALRAGEEMAKAMGDTAFAEQTRAIFEKGSKQTVERLWNGEYFVQDVDLTQHAKSQYKDGCLSDQLFGQNWAHQLGLGYLYPHEHVVKALESIWKYNWAPDIGPYNEAHKPMRSFITPGQAGLITCTWPKSDYLTNGTMYREEVWTGIEYQVAAHLIWEGKVTEGLAMCRAVHDRYHPDLFNPYNEIECGDHYARAMASWGVYLALAGFRYDGPNGRIGFAPRITPDHFRAAFTTAAGWITYEQTKAAGARAHSIEVRAGELRLTGITLAIPGEVKSATVTAGGKKVQVKLNATKEGIVFEFPKVITMKTGEKLEIIA